MFISFVTSATLCCVLRIEGGFLNPRKPPSLCHWLQCGIADKRTHAGIHTDQGFDKILPDKAKTDTTSSIQPLVPQNSADLNGFPVQKVHNYVN